MATTTPPVALRTHPVAIEKLLKGTPDPGIARPPKGTDLNLMAAPFYADVYVSGPVILHLRLRGLDILAATEEGTNERDDHELLASATSLKRVTVTQDIRFRVLTEECQGTGKPFGGLIFTHQ